MKKILPLLMVPFMALTLGACNGGDKGNDASSIPSKTVTITDKDGKEQQIVLKKGKGDQEMATALMYVVHGDYSKVTSFTLQSSLDLHAQMSKSAYVKASLSSKLEATQQSYLNVNFNGSLDSLTEKPIAGNVAADIKWTPRTDENVYVKMNGTMMGETLDTKSYITPANMEELMESIKTKFGQFLPGVSENATQPAIKRMTRPSPLPSITQSDLVAFKNKTVDEMIAFYQNIKQQLPNCSFEVANVDDSYLVIDAKFSLKDILTMAMGMAAPELKGDSIINLNLKFSTKDALVAGLGVDFNCTDLVKNMNEGSTAVVLDETTKFTLSANESITFNDVVPNELTQEEKAQYTEMTFSGSTTKPELNTQA